MQTRYMERSNSMAREKRGLDSTSAEEGQPDRKRPALARYIFFSFSKIEISIHLIQILLRTFVKLVAFLAKILS
jgi:hypothetical protein